MEYCSVHRSGAVLVAARHWEELYVLIGMYRFGNVRSGGLDCSIDSYSVLVD